MVSLDVERSRLRTLAIAHDARYVAGFPVHVALVLAPVGGPVARIALASALRDYGCIGITLRQGSGEDSGSLVRELEPRPRAGGGFAVPRIDLDAPRRVLVDLSALLAGVAPGRYRAAITYAGRLAHEAWASSAPFDLELRAPDENEQAMLEFIRPAVEQYGGWGGWAHTAPAGPGDRAPYSLHREDPARYCRAIRYLLFGDRLDAFDVSLLDALTGVYEPDGVLFAAELLRARGDLEGLRALRAGVAGRFEGLEPVLDETIRGESLLAWHLDQRRGPVNRT